jgi:hypothetical protein
LPEVNRVFDENFQVYGVRKIWRQMKDGPEARIESMQRSTL